MRNAAQEVHSEKPGPTAGRTDTSNIHARQRYNRPSGAGRDPAQVMQRQLRDRQQPDGHYSLHLTAGGALRKVTRSQVVPAM